MTHVFVYYITKNYVLVVCVNKCGQIIGSCVALAIACDRYATTQQTIIICFRKKGVQRLMHEYPRQPIRAFDARGFQNQLPSKLMGSSGLKL